MLLYYDWQSEMEDNPNIINGKSDSDLTEIALELYTSNSEVNFIHENYDISSDKIISLLVTLINYGDFQLLPVATLAANFASF